VRSRRGRASSRGDIDSIAAGIVGVQKRGGSPRRCMWSPIICLRLRKIAGGCARRLRAVA
jgi:hypothetical protein